MTHQFENVLLSNRKNLTPQESAQKVINYALLQDAKQRSRTLRHVKASWVLPALLFTYPAWYLIKGAVNGVWSNIHPTDKVTLSFANIGRPFRLTYRPEIFLRDQQAKFIQLEKEHIEKSKKGEFVETTSPLVLWN
ncbi:hypothetical protein ABPG74_009878 [Tetrahymena malaccensis]